MITGEKIDLIPISSNDTENIVRWRNHVRDKFIYRELFTIESHNKWLETMVCTGKVVQFVIYDKEGRGVGSVFLRDIDYTHKHAEYGIFIGEDEAQGKGYGTEAARLMIQYGFEDLGLHKIMLRAFANNIRAIKSYEKAGFVQEGYLHDEVFLDNKYLDIVLMAVINK